MINKTMENFKTNMLVLGREARGMTQVELAQKLGMEQGTLSKIELEVCVFPKKSYELLCEVLNFPLTFFFANHSKFSANTFYYRRKSKTPVKVLNQVEAKMNIYKMHIEKLLQSVELTEINLPSWDVLESGSPENCANYLREYWRVPKGKIVDLTRLLEHHGIIVVQMDLSNVQVDALSMFTNRQQPIIFINQAMPADRQRFNLAHELGHLLMHFAEPVSEDRNKEEEAMSFASNFLMPKNDVLPNLTSLNLSKLADLKQYWKVSMAALLMRAKKLGTVTENQYQYLWKQMAMNGNKTQEPVFFKKEEPSLLKEMIRLHLEELSYSESELASVLLMYEDEFKKTYLEKSSLKLVQGGSKNIDHRKVKFYKGF